MKMLIFRVAFRFTTANWKRLPTFPDFPTFVTAFPCHEAKIPVKKNQVSVGSLRSDHAHDSLALCRRQDGVVQIAVSLPLIQTLVDEFDRVSSDFQLECGAYHQTQDGRGRYLQLRFHATEGWKNSLI